MDVNMSVTARLILGLRNAGWDEKDINDILRLGKNSTNHSKKIRLNNQPGQEQGRVCHRFPIQK